jgi:ATP-dependent Clp protease protease subunit
MTQKKSSVKFRDKAWGSSVTDMVDDDVVAPNFSTASSTPTDGESKSSIEDNGYYLFMDVVSTSSCREAIKFVMRENFKKPRQKQLTFVINSPGGSVIDCFALIDTMKGSAIPIHTIGIGSIASCGLLLFMSGKKGKRVLTPNTCILSHQWSWAAWGKEHELFAAQKEFELITERILAHYKKCTGLDEKTIRDVLLPPEDRWLSAKEALKYGICDSIKTVY